MTRVELHDDGRVHVTLSLLEQLGALCSSFSVPLAQISGARFREHPWRAAPDRLWSGLRVGTHLPFVILLGRILGWRGGSTFVDVRAGVPALVLDLKPGGDWVRLVVCTPDAAELQARIQKALETQQQGAAQATDTAGEGDTAVQ